MRANYEEAFPEENVRLLTKGSNDRLLFETQLRVQFHSQACPWLDGD
jgi:hypothetical protein